MENIPTIKDSIGRLINDSVDKGNSLNSHYDTLFGCERNVTQITTTHSDEPFTINIKMVRKRLAAIGRSKSIWPEDVPGGNSETGRGSRISVTCAVSGHNLSPCYYSK